MVRPRFIACIILLILLVGLIGLFATVTPARAGGESGPIDADLLFFTPLPVPERASWTRCPIRESRDAASPVPLPRDCNGVSPPGDPDACCAYGYVYHEGEPVSGANVRIASPQGTLTVTTVHGGLSDEPYYTVDLNTGPLDAGAGTPVTLTATYDDASASRTWMVLADGQQVDVGLYTAFSQGPVTFTQRVVDDDFDNHLGGCVHATDVDGDGDVDLVGAANDIELGQNGTDIAWWENDGQQQFTTHPVATDFDGAICAYSSDVDGDGDVDILGAGYSVSDITWWENDGDENFGAHTIDGSFSGAHDVYASDVDGDGDVDVLGAGLSAGMVWWENDGSESFTEHIIDGSFWGARSVYATDVDGDGDVDVLGAGQTVDDITWWENDGDENFTAHTIDGDFDRAFWVYARDLDSDGDVDVIGTAVEADDIAWWENDGDENFTKHLLDGNFDGAEKLHAADLDGDGDIDIAAAARGLNQFAWWENDGSGGFEPRVIGELWGTVTVYLADLDGDSDTDAAGMGYGGGIAWYENLALSGEGWQRTLVDDAGDVGVSASLALDANEYPHIAYQDRTNRDLKYAYYDGATWHTETVHSSGNTGDYSSIAIDADGHPHIAWLYYAPSYSLMYGYHDGTTWHIETVSAGAWPRYISLALDADGHPHLSYFTDVDGGPNANALMYARHDGSQWHLERVDGASVVANTSIVSALALDAQDRPRIAYANKIDRALKYAWYDGTWHIETLRDDEREYGQVALALDAQDRPRVAHVDLSRGVVEYFWHDGSAWHSETVSSAARDTVSLALDAADRPHVSFTDDDGMIRQVKYAYRDAGAWRVGTVALGSGSRLAGASDELHFAYQDPVADNLWAARGPWGAAAPTAPTAAFSASPVTGTVPLDVTFTDHSTGTVSAWTWDLGVGALSGARFPFCSYAAAGIYTVTLSVAGPGGTDVETKPAYITASPVVDPTWLFLLYLDGDNDLDTWLQAALERLEVASVNPYVTILVQIDGSGDDDTWRYQVRPGQDYSWYMGELDMSDPQTLSDFVIWARDAHPGARVYLAVADHGRGTSGIAWDDTTGEDEFISVAELGSALRSATFDGSAPLDVVHYDACLMAMLENAYQIRDYAGYMVASQNLGWSAFAYERYAGSVTTGTTPAELAAAVVRAYDDATDGYPRTLSALDLAQAEAVADAVSALATALRANLAAHKYHVQSSRMAAQKFDSRDYHVINNDDEYLDLYDLARLLEYYVPDDTVEDAAQGVMDAVDALVIAEQHASGYYLDHPYWDLANAHGVSIYFPREHGGWGYDDYVSHASYRFTVDMTWDEFLEDYYGLIGTPPETPVDPGLPPVLELSDSVTVTKTVTPQGLVAYGDLLTYTLTVSATPGTPVGLYDPLTDTTFLRFVTQPAGITPGDGAISGTLTVTPGNHITVSFVAQVGVPGTPGETVTVTNRACVYLAEGGTLGDCTWSNAVTNRASRPAYRASVEKTVTPQGPVKYGDLLTYTLTVSATPGASVGLYDPLTDTTFLRFVARPAGVITGDGAISGTLTVTPGNLITVSFVAQVAVPDVAGETVTVTNRACVYLAEGGTLGDCTWSNAVTNRASRPAYRASVEKTVTPQGPVAYGDLLTYTLSVSATPGASVGLYDPLTDTTFLRFVTRPAGVITGDGAISGTLTVTPGNRVTVSFVAQVDVPGAPGQMADITNRACVYPFGGTLGLCTWSNTVTNSAFRPYVAYLPLVLRE